MRKTSIYAKLIDEKLLLRWRTLIIVYWKGKHIWHLHNWGRRGNQNSSLTSGCGPPEKLTTWKTCLRTSIGKTSTTYLAIPKRKTYILLTLFLCSWSISMFYAYCYSYRILSGLKNKSSFYWISSSSIYVWRKIILSLMDMLSQICLKLIALIFTSIFFIFSTYFRKTIWKYPRTS